VVAPATPPIPPPGTMIEVCIQYPSGSFPPGASPVLLHYPGPTDVTTSSNALTGTVCGRVANLSPFVVAIPSNRPPVAKCRNITRSAGPTCLASVTPSDVDDGSFDPDSDPITLTGPLGPLPLGTTFVTLTV